MLQNNKKNLLNIVLNMKAMLAVYFVVILSICLFNRNILGTRAEGFTLSHHARHHLQINP